MSDQMDYKPGEHPIADIIEYRIETYGVEIDILIRAIRDLTSASETYEWWDKEIGRGGDCELALQKASQRFDELTESQRVRDVFPAIYRITDYPSAAGDSVEAS